MPKNNCNQAALQNLLDGWWLPATGDNQPEFVVACDVGQGNLNAVFNTDGRPFIYFDMGGGIDGSLFTYPWPDPVLCYHAAPNFILSHWDGDHYKTGDFEQLNGRLNNTEWLAPRQKDTIPGVRLGLSERARALRKGLAASGEIYIWPDHAAVGSITASHFRVIHVNGSDLNNHGLALRIASPNGNGDFMLLTGDATFEAGTFPHGCNGNCVGIVSGHHSSEVDTQADIPGPQAAGVYTLIHSFGWGNAYGHPSTTGVNSYDARGWVDTQRLDTAGAETGADHAGPRGNAALLWRAPALGPCAVALGATDAVVNDAAVALVASISAELELYSPGLAEAPQVAAAAAYRAAVEVSVIPARADSARIAAALVAPVQPPPVMVGGLLVMPPAVTLAGVAGGAAVGTLTAALVAAPVSALAASNANVTLLATTVVDAVLTAAMTLADVLTLEAITYAFGTTIGSQSRNAATSAFDFTYDPTIVPQVEAPLTAGLLNPVILAAQAVQNLGLPTQVELQAAIVAALLEGARYAIGHTAKGYAGMLPSSVPPVVAEQAAAVVVLARDDLKAAIAAAVAMAPAISINPEAGQPQMVLNQVVLRRARIAAVAAIIGQHAGATAATAARAGAAAARVALPAAMGAPQINCHRHPRLCPAPCSMSIHYAVL